MNDTAAPAESEFPANAWIPHVVPFVAWLFIMQMLGDPAGWKYALRTVIGVGVFWYCKPWRWYSRLELKHLPVALGVGVFVFVFWIAPETQWANRFPRLQRYYLTFCTQDLGKVLNYGMGQTVLGRGGMWGLVLPALVTLAAVAFRPWEFRGRDGKLPVGLLGVFGAVVVATWLLFMTPWLGGVSFIASWIEKMPAAFPWVTPQPLEEADLAYSPAVAGWHFTLMRIAGSAFVIAFIEEFFWRGWMYRWVIKERFLEVDIGTLKWGAVIAAAVMFSLVHHRWLAAFFCGICYGLLIIKTRDVWAGGVAHATTNLLLGMYVVMTDAYQFWS